MTPLFPVRLEDWHLGRLAEE